MAIYTKKDPRIEEIYREFDGEITSQQAEKIFNERYKKNLLRWIQ